MSTKGHHKRSQIDSISSIVASALVSILLITYSAPAYAKNSTDNMQLVIDDDVQKEITEAIVLEHNDQIGIWFPEPLALEMQKDVEELPILRRQVKLLETQLTLKEKRITILKEVADTNKQVADTSKLALEKAIRLRREAEEDRDGFFAGKPWFWVAVGLVAGIAGSVAIAVLVGKSK